MKKTKTVSALASAAMALPAISQLAEASNMPTKTELGYRYSQYAEDDLDSNDVIAGSVERYEIDNHQFRLVKPLQNDKSVTVDAVYETLTGASALSVVKGADDEPALIMTGASIKEERIDVSAALETFEESASRRYQLGYSTEDDYQSLYGSYSAESISSDRNTTFSYGAGLALDELEPVQAPDVNPPTSEDKWYANVFASLTRVLSSSWQVQFGLQLGLHDGYMSDPYKAIDVRPDEKQLTVVNARSRYFVKSLQAALHTDYRFYIDDWGMESHTLELAWYQNWGDHIQIIPRVRYYSQSQVDFYVSYDDPNREGYQSSDFQLSPFGALAYGLGIVYREEKFSVSAYMETYESEGSLALKSVKQENPALVSYGMFSLGVDYRY